MLLPRHLLLASGLVHWWWGRNVSRKLRTDLLKGVRLGVMYVVKVPLRIESFLLLLFVKVVNETVNSGSSFLIY